MPLQSIQPNVLAQTTSSTSTITGNLLTHATISPFVPLNQMAASQQATTTSLNATSASGTSSIGNETTQLSSNNANMLVSDTQNVPMQQQNNLVPQPNNVNVMSSTASVSVSAAITMPLSSVTTTDSSASALPSAQNLHIASQQPIIFGNIPLSLSAPQQQGNFGNLGSQQPVSFALPKTKVAIPTSDNAIVNNQVMPIATQQPENSMSLQKTASIQQKIPSMEQSTPATMLYRTVQNTNYQGATSDNHIVQTELPTQAMEQLSINEDADMTNATADDHAHQAFLHFRNQIRPYVLGIERIGVRTQDSGLKYEAFKCQEEMLGTYYQRIAVKAEQLEASEVLTPAFESALHEFLLEVDDTYATIKTAVLINMNNVSASQQPTNASVRERNVLDQIALKPISFERFDGDEDRWSNFKAKWLQFFHNNPNMDNLTKFLRLDAYIEKNSEAYQAISGIERLPEHYNAAWQHLVSVYDDPQRIINKYINRFIDKAPITTPTRNAIIDLLNAINHLTASLQQYPDLNVSSWDALIVNLAVRKLDDETLSFWRHARPKRQIPTLKPLLDFLNQRADGNDRSTGSSANRQSNVRQQAEGAVGYTPARPNASAQQPQQQSNAGSNQQRMRSHIKVPVKCSLCGGEHQLFSCSTFRKLPVDQRIRRARQFQVCEKCLKPRCRADRCKLGPCRHCQGNHNGLLCTVISEPTVMATQGQQ